jgi:hypothetical protein
MPFVGLGIHFLIALFFAVHAIRSGQPLFWLFILFSFPLLGSLVYFVTIYLPNSRLERGAMRAVAAAGKAIDPERELREARSAFEDTPTAQNQMRLASALLDLGYAEEAARNYEACLQGPFANDSEIKFLAARALVDSGRYQEAITYLQGIQAADQSFRAQAVAILLARAYAGANRVADARNAFESALTRFGGFEVLAEYTIWALQSGNIDTANRLQAELDKVTKRWDRNTRYLNARTLRRLDEAYKRSNRPS